MARAKVCGINSARAFDAACDAGADWIGFVFFPASPRYVSPAMAAGLAARRSGGPLRVGLFVNPADADIAGALAEIDLDLLQLYTTAGRAADIRARFARPVWRAVGIAAPADLPARADGADALLLESKPPPQAARPGGNATRFDWTIPARHRPAYPWLLAGGLDADNVADAIRAAGAPAVDASSGLESAPGVKDPARIAAFVARAHAAQP